MKTFPAFHALTARKVIIAGDGEAASNKARLAAAAGAKITFIATGLARSLLEEWPAAEFDARTPRPELFAGAALAFIAMNNADAAARLAAMARAAGVPVNVVDRPELCDFLTPSIIARGDIIIGVSTGAAAPVLSRRIREAIEKLLPSRMGALAAFANSFRRVVGARIAPENRRDFWERFFDGPIAAQILAGDERRAREAMFDAVNRPQTERGMGVVHLVGAGPGDPDLLTLKALRLLQAADVIVYDRLVSPEILSLARRDALRIYVGKAKAAHAVPQKEIEQRLVHHARKGKTVIRLKGGDPFIFGRGGEELSALRRAGVPVFVTPGVTAAIGCAAAAGMALTHRGLSQAITFVTGHAKDDGEPDINWKALAALGHTIVVYMGVGKAGAISRAMLENGASPATPVAVVEKGTTAQQKILKGRLEELERLIEAGGVEGPAVLVIGEVAQMASGAVLLELAASERRAA